MSEANKKVNQVKVLINGRERDAIMRDPILGGRSNRAWSLDLNSASSYNNNGSEYFTSTLCQGEYSLRPVVSEISLEIEVSEEVYEKLNW